MSTTSAYPPFDSEEFLKRIDLATNSHEVLQLLRELEQHCASLEADICQSFSDQVASRLSYRFMQVR